MKRRFFVLISCFLVSFLVSFPTRNAHAGVPCSVPFNLTNGTTADATQVMANYNAILSCLSTSAAANGINSDITTLNALTTPITPAQGGAQALCGATGFFAKNDATFPNTSVDITFIQAVVTNPLHAVQFASNGSLVLNFSSIGVDGLDTGAQAANTTYYTYLIGNGSAVHSLASLSSTSPTLPAGYTFSCRIGSLRTNVSTQLYSFFQQGRTVSLLSSVAGDANFQNTSTQGTCGTLTFANGVFTGIPATAGYAVGYIFGTPPSGRIAVGRSALTSGAVAELSAVTATAILIPFEVGLLTASTLAWCNDTSSSQGITVNGWVDSVNVN